jgi:2,3-bisphosphoglycerate-dependent phosphoglycerate mutase
VRGPDPAHERNPESSGPAPVSAGDVLGPTRLVLVRHGEAVCNVRGVIGGRKGCTGLTSLGRAQVGALAARLGRTRELAGTAALYASVLPRALETAAILRPVLEAGTGGADLEPRERCDLCELHPGEADALTWAQYAERFGTPDWDLDPTVPIAPGGESWTGFVARAAGALEAVVRGHPGGLVVVACHAGVIEASMLALLPIDATVARRRMRPDHAGITEWEFDGGWWLLRRFNDVTPLDAAQQA